jgi:hypothetical protein
MLPIKSQLFDFPVSMSQIKDYLQKLPRRRNSDSNPAKQDPNGYKNK